MVEAGPDQTDPIDSDEDGIADYRETDADDDAWSDTLEAGGDPAKPDRTPTRTAPPDYRETDSDNDGLSDTLEAGDDSGEPDGYRRGRHPPTTARRTPTVTA